MIVFVAVMLVSGFVFLAIYSPVIIENQRVKKTEKEFLQELGKLNELYEQSRMIVNRKLGEGEEPVLGPSFANVQCNQEFAVNSVLDLI